jgi:4-carboxymuconolactone decarboxylase
VSDGAACATWPIADSWLADFVASRGKRAWGEQRLSERERAFVALTAHVSQRALGASFRRHVQLALEVATPNEVRDAVRFTAETGITETAAALEELEKILGGS